MKSEKAEAYIDSHAKRAEECCCEVSTYIGQIVLPVVQVIHAVELAERETEERMRAKAIEEHRKCCFFRDYRNNECANTATKCGEHTCFYMNEFIQKMSDDE